MIDWEFAASVGGRLAGQGPEVSRVDAEQVVAELRSDAMRSTGLVREFTGLSAPDGTAPVLVVDRASWVRANTESFGVLLQPVVDKLAAKKGPPSGAALAVGQRHAAQGERAQQRALGRLDRHAAGDLVVVDRQADPQREPQADVGGQEHHDRADHDQHEDRQPLERRACDLPQPRHRVPAAPG